jgi:hypothetical protein
VESDLSEARSEISGLESELTYIRLSLVDATETEVPGNIK